MSRAEGSLRSHVIVLIAEANQLNCQLIQSAFRRSRRRVVVSGATVETVDALNVLKEQQPDVAVVSSRLITGPLDGFNLVRNIRTLKLRTRVVMLLESRERELVIDAFRVGAHGVVFRDEPLETLTKCIHAVREGQVWANSLNLGYLLDALVHAMPFSAPKFSGTNRLTRRETDIVKLLVEGMTNREISAQLRLSEHTVRNYLFKVFDKVGVSTRVELVLYFLRHTD